MLVYQTNYRVEVFERNIDFWKYRLIEAIDALIDLPLLSISLPMSDIYDGIVLAAE